MAMCLYDCVEYCKLYNQMRPNYVRTHSFVQTRMLIILFDFFSKKLEISHYMCMAMLDISPCSYESNWLQTDISPCSYQPSQVPHNTLNSILCLAVLLQQPQAVVVQHITYFCNKSLLNYSYR